MNLRTLLLGSALCLVLISAARADQAEPAAAARQHFAAIAAGNVDQLMQGYAEQASFEWVGGPLDGHYAGTAAIRKLWEKFSASQGPLKVSIARLDSADNPKGSTVTADVRFEGKSPIMVRYVLVYRDEHIVGEVWQIAPKLKMADGDY